MSVPAQELLFANGLARKQQKRAKSSRHAIGLGQTEEVWRCALLVRVQAQELDEVGLGERAAFPLLFVAPELGNAHEVFEEGGLRGNEVSREHRSGRLCQSTISIDHEKRQ